MGASARRMQKSAVMPTLSTRYGIAAGSRMGSLSETALIAELSDIRALGLGIIRFDIEWCYVEPQRGVYNWTVPDRLMRCIASYGMRAIAIITYTPEWARPNGAADSKFTPPGNPADYAAFAAAVAARYARYSVLAYEIWNEPNLGFFFAPMADPAKYVQLLKAAYPLIKDKVPETYVITGGTAPAGTDGTNMSPPDFVQAFYAAGAAGYFDALSVHPYTYPVTATYPNPYNAWGQQNDIRTMMIDNGDQDKTIWATEYGAPTGGPGPTATRDNLQLDLHPNHVDEALQADMVRDAISLHDPVAWKGPLLWYSNKDAGTAPDSNENFFGLVRADGSKKPAYEAMRDNVAASRYT